MLRGIHTATRNWLGRVITGVILGLIAISFAVWGIGDIFRGFGQSTVAKIGRTEITVEQFRQLYTDRQQQLIRQFGRALNAEQLRALVLHRQLLAQLVAETALCGLPHRTRWSPSVSAPIRISAVSTGSSTRRAFRR
jgi:peptidyl-prolyl cis-trans isomerase D